MKVSVVVFAAVVCSLCYAASIQRQDDPADLFEIEVETAPENGGIAELRVRRGGDLNRNVPEIDIRRINDDLISVNGIRLKRRSDFKDLSDVELDEEASEESESANSDRTRRSGSGDILGFIGQKIGQKISSFASASSGHNSESDHYGSPVTKAIVATLLQAAKAIKGGVIALGGQIIKAKGHLIAAKGRYLASKGDDITQLGKEVAAKALLSPSSSHGSSATGYGSSGIEHAPDSGYSSGGLTSGYAGPTQPGFVSVSSAYGIPSQHGYNKRGATSQQYAVPHELPSGVQAGLLLLKPINVPEEKSSYGKRKAAFVARDSDSSQTDSDVEVEATRDTKF